MKISAFCWQGLADWRQDSGVLPKQSAAAHEPKPTNQFKPSQSARFTAA
jgi:hypothetical protein